MPFKIYVTSDSKGQPWPPDQSHESEAAIEIIKHLFLVFDHQPHFYSVVANVHKPSADLVIISPRGIGLVELKHYYGGIRQSGSAWFAGPIRIKAGAKSQGYENPHEQVQAYAGQIRERLIDPRHQGIPWLPGRKAEWQNFKFGTSVCFTHPDASLKKLKRQVRQGHHLSIEQWENFRVLEPKEVPDWVASLRFEVDKGQKHHFAPYTLTAEQIVRISTRLLGGTEWEEILKLMPKGEPYGYLRLIVSGLSIIIFLDDQEVIIGRDPHTCQVVIPEAFSCVSRNHARLVRTIGGRVSIEDLSSKNGTFVDGQEVKKRRELAHGKRITLGGPRSSDEICQLEFLLTSQAITGPGQTATRSNSL